MSFYAVWVSGGESVSFPFATAEESHTFAKREAGIGAKRSGTDSVRLYTMGLAESIASGLTIPPPDAAEIRSFRSLASIESEIFEAELLAA